MIYIISSKNAAALKRSLGPAKNTWVELLPQIPRNLKIPRNPEITSNLKIPRNLKIPAERKLKAGDQVYLDISGLSPAELKKALGPLLKRGDFCGIIDPKGTAKDPALFFFMGASDYIGPALVKKGLNKRRFTAALAWALEKKSPEETGAAAVKTGDAVCEPDEEAPKKKKSQKLLAGKFEGWQSVRSGTTGYFLFLFVSLSAKSNIRSLAGEAAFNTVKNRLRDILQQRLAEADALLWMDTEGSSIFLVPPVTANGRSVIEAVLKIILNSRLIGMEKLDLPAPVEFTFALHYGKTTFQTRGKTGTVISEPVNYIFHLGLKKAEPGRLTVSDEVPDEVFPAGLKDFFSPAGVFEGIPICHSRRFV